MDGAIDESDLRIGADNAVVVSNIDVHIRAYTCTHMNKHSGVHNYNQTIVRNSSLLSEELFAEVCAAGYIAGAEPFV